MSAAFKLAKKKYSQQDLRRLMNDAKANKQQTDNVKRIESPLAKYNEANQLTCVLCRSVVRSEAVWKVHINSKQHKENVEAAKRLKEQHTAAVTAKAQVPPVAESSSSEFKRPGSPVSSEHGPNKKPKSTVESGQNGSALPSDFFDAGGGSTIRKDLVNIRRPSKNRDEPMEQDPAETPEVSVEEEKLPEGFFDDPKMDAKARNTEYKDPNDEEWDRFQKEIKEATNVSMAIISEEQEESTAERQIAEIDEQIRNWSRVLDLEKKKEQVKTVKQRGANSRKASRRSGDESSGEEGDQGEDGFDEFLDWRAKKSYK